jgi:hypothetical protein
MRPLLSLVNVGVVYAYNEIIRRRITILLFETDGRDSLNSCFRAALAGTRRGPIIFGQKRLLKRRNKLKRSLMT